MSFGGGSSGSAALTAHTHNESLSGDGGQLSETLTDMNGVTLFSLITDNGAAVAANTAAIAAANAIIATNTTNIATNASNIVANTALITTNQGNIATNVTAIAANAALIATNTSKLGKWSATNAATFRTSVIAGATAGVIEEV